MQEEIGPKSFKRFRRRGPIHNEELMNAELARVVPIHPTENARLAALPMWDPHVKAFLLLQAHMYRVPTLPVSDYVGDTTSVLDQFLRVVQAGVDIAT